MPRMQKTGVPVDRAFRTKWQIALDLIDRVLGWDIPKCVIVSNALCGVVHPFRQGLIDRELFYVVGIESSSIVFDEPAKTRGRVGDSPHHQAKKAFPAREFAQKLPARMWKTINWREGTQRTLVSRFAAVRVQPAYKPAEGESHPPRQWLLIEWPRGEPGPTRYWFSNLPPQTGLSRLVQLAKIRWTIEQARRQFKEELGLDHYEGRGFLGWHHHITMSMLAFGFLLLENLPGAKT